MNEGKLISRKQLANRWSVTAKTIDRLRRRGILPWVDISSGKGSKPLVRFRLHDVVDYEFRNRLAAREQEVRNNASK